MKKKRHKLTEKEQDDIGREMVSAAFDSFGEFTSVRELYDIGDIPRRVIRAIVAAEKCRADAVKRLDERFGAFAYFPAETHKAVATAFFLWTNEFGVDEDVSWDSVGGNVYLEFARGIVAAIKLSEAMEALDDEDQIFGLDISGAVRLAEKGYEVPQDGLL